MAIILEPTVRRLPLVPALLAAVAAACTATRPDPGHTTAPTTTVVSAGVGSMTIGTVATSMASSRTLGLPADSVWGVLPGVFASLGMTITTLRPAEHVIGAEGMRVRRRLADAPLPQFLSCGGAPGMPNAERYDVRLSVVTRLERPEPSSRLTSVVTLVEATAREPGVSTGSVRCGSTGRLEDRIFALVRERLSAAK